MTTFRATIPESVEEWATDVFFMRYAALREQMIYPQFMRVDNSERAFEEAWEVSGLGTFALKPEGGPIAYDDPVQGNRTRITHQTFALGTRQTMEMIEDDRWDIARRLPEDLADSARDHQDRLAHGPVNDAFTGTTFTGLDGLALCTTVHTSLKGGGARSNSLNPPADLSQAAMEAMLTMARTTVDEAGRFIPFNLGLLLVSPQNEYEAQRILESEYEPGNANNAINVMTRSRTGADLLVTPYLTDPDDWFMMDRGRHDVRYFDRKGVTTNSGTDMDTLDVKTTAHYRAGVGFWKWEGFFGSNAP